MSAEAHSKVGASSAHRWLECTASVKASEGITRVGSEYAAEGTCAHALAEMCLRQDLDADHFLFETLTAEVDGKPTDYEVTEDMASSVQVYLDYVRKVRDELDGSTLHVEHRFDLEHIHQGMFGTCDAVITQPFGKIVVIDYKHGAGKPVDVEDNSQLKYYGVGALTLPEAMCCEEIELVIVQPRAPHKRGPVRCWSVPGGPQALIDWSQGPLRNAVAEALGPNPKYKAGEHCKWCPAAAVCPKFRDHATGNIPGCFSPIVKVATPPKPKPVHELTADEMSRILKFADIFSNWVGEVQSYARAKLERGEEVTGWKLVNGRASRKWTDDKQVVDSLPADVIYERKMRSPAQVEKELKARKQDPAVITPLITTTVGISMVPADDPRPTVSKIPAFTQLT